MRQLIDMKLVVTGVLWIGICGCDSTELKVRKINERDYQKTVSFKGTPVLKAECKYLGKQPQDIEEFQSKFNHDCITNDTDFYQITLTNLSKQKVLVQSADYRMKIGTYRGKSRFTSKDFATTWGRSEIPPNENVARDTHFVWAVKDSNVLYKTYSFESRDVNGKPFVFQMEIPLLYSR